MLCLQGPVMALMMFLSGVRFVVVETGLKEAPELILTAHVPVFDRGLQRGA